MKLSTLICASASLIATASAAVVKRDFCSDTCTPAFDRCAKIYQDGDLLPAGKTCDQDDTCRLQCQASACQLVDMAKTCGLKCGYNCVWVITKREGPTPCQEGVTIIGCTSRPWPTVDNSTGFMTVTTPYNSSSTIISMTTSLASPCQCPDGQVPHAMIDDITMCHCIPLGPGPKVTHVPMAPQGVGSPAQPWVRAGSDNCTSIPTAIPSTTAAPESTTSTSCTESTSEEMVVSPLVSTDFGITSNSAASLVPPSISTSCTESASEAVPPLPPSSSSETTRSTTSAVTTDPVSTFSSSPPPITMSWTVPREPSSDTTCSASSGAVADPMSTLTTRISISSTDLVTSTIAKTTTTASSIPSSDTTCSSSSILSIVTPPPVPPSSTSTSCTESHPGSIIPSSVLSTLTDMVSIVPHPSSIMTSTLSHVLIQSQPTRNPKGCDPLRQNCPAGFQCRFQGNGVDKTVAIYACISNDQITLNTTIPTSTPASRLSECTVDGMATFESGATPSCLHVDPIITTSTQPATSTPLPSINSTFPRIPVPPVEKLARALEAGKPCYVLRNECASGELCVLQDGLHCGQYDISGCAAQGTCEPAPAAVVALGARDTNSAALDGSLP